MEKTPESATHWSIPLGLLTLAAAMVHGLPHLSGLPLFIGIAWWLAWPWRNNDAVFRMLWLVTGLGLLELGVATWSVLSPFVAAFVIAYLLDPLIALLSRKMKRGAAALLIVSLFIVVVLLLVSLTFPVLIRETGDLLKEVPRMAGRAEQWTSATLPDLLASTGISTHEVNQFLQNKGPEILRSLLTAVGSSSQALLGWAQSLGSSVMNLFLIPFLVYSFNLGSPKFATTVRDSLKPAWKDGFERYLGQTDRVLSGYVRGQLIVSLVIATLTWLGLWVCGVPYPLLLGLATGMLNVIPYIGISFIFMVSLLVAIIGMDPLGGALRVAAVFLVVQGLEGFVISPRILGDAVGLSPVMALFCLMFFGSLFGVAGMIIAIPLGGILLFIARDLHLYWLKSIQSALE